MKNTRQQFQQQPQQHQQSYAGFGPQNWTRSDEFIKDDVCRRLYLDASLDATNIEVQVSGGTITLTGHVDQPRAKMTAQNIALNVPGAKGVNNSLALGQHTPQYASSSVGSATGGTRRS